MKRQWFSALLLACLGCVGPASASPWLLSGGEQWMSINASRYTATHYWDKTGVLKPIGCKANNHYVNLRYEYGWSYYYTLITGINLADQRCGNIRERGMGDAKVGIRGRINKFRNGRAWEVVLVIPTGYSRTSPSRLGYGRFGLELAAEVATQATGYEVQKKLFWEGGARLVLWQGPPAHQMQPYIKLVGAPTNYDRLSLRASGNFSLGNGAPEILPFVNQARLNESDKISVDATYTHRFRNGLHVLFNARQDIWGRNSGKNTAFGAAISFTRR